MFTSKKSINQKPRNLSAPRESIKKRMLIIADYISNIIDFQHLKNTELEKHRALCRFLVLKNDKISCQWMLALMDVGIICNKGRVAMNKLNWTRPVIRLRTAGTVYIVMTIVLGAVSLNTSNNLFYLMTAMMLGYMLASGLVGRANVRSASVSVSLPDEIYASVPCAVQINVTNKNRFTPIFLIEIALEQENGRTSTLFSIVQPGATESRTVFSTFPERGRHPFEEVELSSTFPFNFFVRYWPVDSQAEAIVFPQPFVCESDATFAVLDEEQEGETPDPLAETDIVGVRPYVEGDSMRRVHWKSSARTGKLQSRLYDGAFANLPRRVVDLDRLISSGLERGLSMAAYVVAESVKSKLPVGLKSGDLLIPPASDYNHKKNLLTHLALYEER